MIRLDKFLSDAGAASRREAKELLKAGRVTVNGAVCRAGEQKIDPARDAVALDGAALRAGQGRVFMLNKPAGVVTATEDKTEKTVLELLPPELKGLGLFPVGRLDKDTTGLLLLTNDGDLAHRVSSPRHHVPKVYLAEVDALLEAADAERFRAGLTLADGTNCLPAELEILERQRCRVTLREGKYHQVKRMLSACGKRVTALHRISVGGLALDEKLPQGALRELNETEIASIFKEL